MEFFADLDSLISSQDTTNASAPGTLAKIGSPSVSIAILDHGIITSKCISTIGDDSETLFQACSISKPITGMATMRLIQAGKLQLDSKIVDVLPKPVISILETPHSKALLQQITVKHLMSHTSGLSIGGFPGYSKDAPDAETVLSGNAPANTSQVRVQCPPGYAFSYSGGGMTVLQIILETVTGKDFPSLLKELVFEPLDMTRSFYTLPDGERNVAKAHFTGYTPCDVDWHTFPEKAAAGLWTTPTDLLKVVRAIQSSLNGDGKSFLEKQMAQKMLEEVQESMALTWVAPRDPGTFFDHSGSNAPGWECFVMGYADLKDRNESQQSLEEKPWDDCGVCIMTNSAKGLTVWAKIFHAVTYLKKWDGLSHADGKGLSAKIPFCVYGEKADEKWVEWRGSWRDGEKELVLESNEEGVPVLRFGETTRVRLVPAAIPSVGYAGKGNSIDLVLEGLEMMLRLGWKEGKRATELCYDGTPPRVIKLARSDE